MHFHALHTSKDKCPIQKHFNFHIFMKYTLCASPICEMTKKKKNLKKN